MELFELIIDGIARIVVPVVIALIGRKVIKNVNNTRLDNIEKEFREHIRGYSDEDAGLIEKTIKEVFSRPSMRW